MAMRGNGLFTAHAALAAFEEDPHRLERARVRFERSPPPYTFDRSGTTTCSPSPSLLNDEQRIRQERRDQLDVERSASVPYLQFQQQCREEMDRILEADKNGTHPIPIGVDLDTIVYNNVRQQWNEQGLWSDTWTIYASGVWKHEQPIEPVSESETDSDTPKGSRPSLFGSQARPRRMKSEEKRRREAQIRQRDREASRPYHQFVYQISKERERMREALVREDECYADDINTEAYNHVQSLWRKRKIWNDKWGTIPGMSWKHEQPWEEVLAEHGLQDLPVTSEAPVVASTGSPLTGLFQPSISNHSHPENYVNGSVPPQSDSVAASGVLNTAPQKSRGAGANFLSANAQRTKIAPRSTHCVPGKTQGSAAPTRVTRSSKTNPISNGDQMHAPASVSPNSVSRKSKSSTKGQPVRKPPSETTQKPTREISASPLHETIAASLINHKRARRQKPGRVPNGHMKQDASGRQKMITSGCSHRDSSAKPEGIAKRRSLRNLATKARNFTAREAKV